MKVSTVMDTYIERYAAGVKEKKLMQGRSGWMVPRGAGRGEVMAGALPGGEQRPIGGRDPATAGDRDGAGPGIGGRSGGACLTERFRQRRPGRLRTFREAGRGKFLFVAGFVPVSRRTQAVRAMIKV